ncbi:MAG: DUF4276 family protein, partial [Gemmataceae bacterium]
LNAWLPRFLGAAHSFRIIVHQGKGELPKDLTAVPDPKHRGLLDQLPAKLKAYGKTLQSDTDRVVVLIDLDDEDCKQLLMKLNRVVDSCNPKPQVLFRIAIEETEAFFLGDIQAIKKAYPKAKTSKLKNHTFDAICGTWEKLRDVIGETERREDKVEWAELIGTHLGTKYTGKRGTNKSPSFQKLCEGLKRICGDSSIT